MCSFNCSDVPINFTFINTMFSVSDLSGTLLESNHPIAVFSGNNFAVDGDEADLVSPVHLVEQLPPVSEWGSTFYLVPFPGVSDGFTYRILTATPNNKIVIQTSRSTSNSTYSLNTPGEVLTQTQPDGEYVIVRSSQPVQVAQFAGGTYQSGKF
jgi:hypothetical protein